MSTTIELIDKFKALNKKFRNFAKKLIDESETFPELLNYADIMGVPNISNIDETTTNEAKYIYEDYETLINSLNTNNIVISDIGIMKNINERIEQLISTIIMAKKNILDYLSFLEDDENDINLSNQGRKKKRKKRKKIKRKKGTNKKSTNKKGNNKKGNNKKGNNKKTKNRKYKKGKKYTEK